MKTRRVGEVIELQRRKVQPVPFESYQEIGVRSFGRGIFHKEPVLGAALGTKRIFRICPGDLIFHNVFAWEGAVALAGAAEAGKYGSHRFMTYTARTGDVDLAYLRYFFLSEAGLAGLGRASPGSAGRNRTLAIDRFEALEIPIPEVNEQQRIVARLDTLRHWLTLVLSRAQSSPDDALVDAAIQGILDGSSGPLMSLGDVAEVNPRPTRTAGLVAFVPMRAVDDELGTISEPELRVAADVGSGFKQFRQGDVIFARITPCMQNGKAAVMNVPDTAFGYGSTEFHVLRPGPRVLSDWVHRIVRSRGFREAAAERFTGTAGQQRVPAEFLRTASVPVPTLEEQRDIISRVDRIAQLGVALRSARASGVARARALEPSLLNAAISGRL